MIPHAPPQQRGRKIGSLPSVIDTDTPHSLAASTAAGTVGAASAAAGAVDTEAAAVAVAAP